MRSTRGKDNDGTNHSIYPHWFRSLPMRIHSTVVAMYITRLSRLCDANQAHKEMTKDADVHKEKSSQSRDLTRGRIGQGPKHLKFFLLVFLMFRICCK